MTAELPVSELGRRLASARLWRGLSQGTVARRAGIAPSYLSRIENGKVQPTFRTVLRVQRALRVDLREILACEKAGGPGWRGACPISRTGVCLLESIRPEREALRDKSGECYTPREIRLVRQLACWIKTVNPDRLRAMEVLMEDLASGETAKH